jgi:1-acyl-sn-glycerol-3-phosphate acyltransferase
VQAVNRPGWLAARRVLKWTAGPALVAASGFRVRGAERLPRRRQPLILACNHAAFADTVWLTAAVGPRFVVCGGRPRLFRTAARRALMALGNVLPAAEPTAYVEACAALLRAGEVLLCYPEQRRNPLGLGPFHPWVAEIALAAGVPLLPCYLYGTTQGHSGPPWLAVGDALPPAGHPAALTADLRAAIAALGPPGTA